jgi:Kef-type K+ transport system membrane component KefB
MKIDSYSVLIILSVLVVLSYIFNYLSGKLKIPSVLLLLASGVGLKYTADYLGFDLPPTQTLLEILGIMGLIFIVLEASLDLSIERKKLPLIGRAFISALALLALTAGLIAVIFVEYYQTTFRLALIHAIPLSVISSAIAIPSVSKMEENKKEFIIYESTFSDILGILAFNYLVAANSTGMAGVLHFGSSIILILLISVLSTMFLIFMLNHSTSHVRFFLTFSIIILAYSIAKFFHLPSLILVLCFGLVLNNFRSFNFPLVRKWLSFDKLTDVNKEIKLMTAETAFVIRTFFFLLFGYSINVDLISTKEVILMGVAIITITLILRFFFLKFFLKINSAPLMLIAPRGLITILLFYSIPEDLRLVNLSEGVLFVVIVLTGVMMAVGLMLNKRPVDEKAEDFI